MSNQLVGTPDNQRGVFSPQQFVGQMQAGGNALSVGLFPNTESLLVIGASTRISGIEGLTTGNLYPFVYPDPTNLAFAIAIVSPAIDQAVEIGFAGGSATAVFAVADAGVRSVVDPSLQAVFSVAAGGAVAPGRAFLVAGSSPSVGGGDAYTLETDSLGHLLIVEMGANSKVKVTVANAGSLLAAPAANTANKITQCVVSVATVPEVVQLVGGTSGVVYGAVPLATVNGPAVMPLSGVINVTEALVVEDTINSQNITASLHYRNVPTN